LFVNGYLAAFVVADFADFGAVERVVRRNDPGVLDFDLVQTEIGRRVRLAGAAGGVDGQDLVVELGARQNLAGPWTVARGIVGDRRHALEVLGERRQVRHGA